MYESEGVKDYCVKKADNRSAFEKLRYNAMAYKYMHFLRVSPIESHRNAHRRKAHRRNGEAGRKLVLITAPRSLHVKPPKCPSRLQSNMNC